MVCEWGMSELGPLAFRKPGNGYDGDKAHVVSEATAQRVDEEIRKVVMAGYDHARRIIQTNRPAVELMAQTLLDVESIDADEIKAILARAGATLN
jgi:cell division protease FtsH